MLIARVRFCSCDRSSWHWTTIPVGRWVRRTAVAFFWTFCPPAPPERKTSILMSFSGMSISISLASAKTATVAVEGWIRPCDSVPGQREKPLSHPAEAGVAGRQSLGFPAMFLGVAGVHAEQVGGEEGRLVAA